MTMETCSYVSCIKVNGTSILPPLLTPQIRQKCLEYKKQATEIEQKWERDKLFKKCMLDLDSLEHQTKELTVTRLENQLEFDSHVPYETYKKMQHLTSETIDVSEYGDEGVKVLNETNTPPKLIRSNSYTLDTPSPILLAHLEKEARKCAEVVERNVEIEEKCVEIDSDKSLSPVTIIDTDIHVQKVEINEEIDPQLLDLLQKIPEEQARNILEILQIQKDNNQNLQEKLDEDKSITVSISSQSLHFSTLSPDTTRESPDLSIHKLQTLKNGDKDISSNLKHNYDFTLDPHTAASRVQAYVRGYLIRRLLRTEKVQGLIETIKDALLCALELHSVEVIEVSDVELHRRLIQQVSAACCAFHDVFFALSARERMGIIAQDRQRKVEKAKRPLSGAKIVVSRRQSAKIQI